MEKINVHIRGFICDSPAKSFICGIKGHMAYSGFAKCQQVGEKVDNVVTYSTTAGKKEQTKASEQDNCMHLLDLGV
ncbi:hypothetical protein CVS40_11352 [Lucilia cuprina]|nr:hypothetical protein CVS40_11352 [Lucilia cuprina]